MSSSIQTAASRSRASPPSAYSLSVRIRGYRLSPKNHSLDAQNPRLTGTIDQDINTLKILLEPAAH